MDLAKQDHQNNMIMATAQASVPKGVLQPHQTVFRRLLTWLSPNEEGPFTSSTTSSPSPNSLIGVPVEIKQAIFSSLADVATLKALVLTCSSLNHAFIGGKSLILTNILQSQIDPSLLQDALATFHFSRYTPTRKRNLMQCVEIEQRYYPLPIGSLRDALDLSELHGHVEFFAK